MNQPLGSIPQNVPAPKKSALIYVASPIACYSTSRYEAMLAHVRRHYPQGDLLPARGLYRDNVHWKATWPQHLEHITTVVFFADTDGSIGRGVVTEIENARRRGVPVHFLDDGGELIPEAEVMITLLDEGASWRRYAAVRVKRTQRARKTGREA